MPRFLVTEKRALYSAILIDAENWEAARNHKGDIVDEAETDTWADSFVSCEQVDDTTEVAEVP